MTESMKISSCPCKGKGRYLVIASVALNIFLAGALLGGGGNKPQESMPRPDFGPGRMMEHMEQRMSSEDATKLHAIFESMRAEADQNREGVHEAAEKMRAVLGAETLDQEKLKEALLNLRAADAKMHEGMDNAILRAATELSVDGRKHLVPFGPGMMRRPPEEMQGRDMPPPPEAGMPAGETPAAVAPVDPNAPVKGEGVSGVDNLPPPPASEVGGQQPAAVQK